MVVMSHFLSWQKQLEISKNSLGRLPSNPVLPITLNVIYLFFFNFHLIRIFYVRSQGCHLGLFYFRPCTKQQSIKKQLA